MDFTYLFEEVEKDPLWFRSEMTRRQFASVAHKLANGDLENELLNNKYFLQVQKAKNLDLKEVEKWIKNSWNTERVLYENKTIIANTQQSFCMQWAFPQAYYAAYGSVLAMYKAVGLTASSHTSVLRQFGYLIDEKKMPESLCWHCKGTKKSPLYINIDKGVGLKPMDFDLENPKVVDHQICQFLKGTRELKLLDRAKQMTFKTKGNRPRKSLTEEMWQQVSQSIGNTTILDLLYRKRIKANYDDIEVFSSHHFKGMEVLTALTTILDRINMVNESFVAKLIGLDYYNHILQAHLKTVSNDPVENRFKTIESLIKSF